MERDSNRRVVFVVVGMLVLGLLAIGSWIPSQAHHRPGHSGGKPTTTTTTTAPPGGGGAVVTTTTTTTTPPPPPAVLGTQVTRCSTGNAGYVCQLYRDLLNRDGEPAGVAAWVDALNARRLSRHQVATAFANGTEFRQRAVRVFYLVYLRRAADPAGLNASVAAIAGGASFEQVEAVILGSAEYFASRAGNNATAWLNALYQDVLGRAPDPAGAAGFAASLARGVSRTAIAQTVLTSVEARTSIVRFYYVALMRRVADPAGLAGYVGALNAGARQEQVIAALVASDEYFAHLPYS